MRVPGSITKSSSSSVKNMSYIVAACDRICMAKMYNLLSTPMSAPIFLDTLAGTSVTGHQCSMRDCIYESSYQSQLFPPPPPHPHYFAPIGYFLLNETEIRHHCAVIYIDERMARACSNPAILSDKYPCLCAIPPIHRGPLTVAQLRKMCRNLNAGNTFSASLSASEMHDDLYCQVLPEALALRDGSSPYFAKRKGLKSLSAQILHQARSAPCHDLFSHPHSTLHH